MAGPASALAAAKRQDKSLFETNPLMAIGLLLSQISAGARGEAGPLAGVSKDAAALLRDDRRARLDELRSQKLRQDVFIAALKAVAAAGPDSKQAVAESLAANMGGDITAEKLLQMSEQEPSELQESMDFSSFQQKSQAVLQEVVGAGQAVSGTLDPEQRERFSLGMEQEFPANDQGRREINLDTLVTFGEQSGIQFSEAEIAAAEKRRTSLAGQGIPLEDGTQMIISVPSLGEETAETAIKAAAEREPIPAAGRRAGAVAAGTRVGGQVPLAEAVERKGALTTATESAKLLAEIGVIGKLAIRAAGEETGDPDIDRLSTKDAGVLQLEMMTSGGFSIEFDDEGRMTSFTMGRARTGDVTARTRERREAGFDRLIAARDVAEKLLSLQRTDPNLFSLPGRIQRYVNVLTGVLKVAGQDPDKYLSGIKDLVRKTATTGTGEEVIEAARWLKLFEGKTRRVDALFLALEFDVALILSGTGRAFPTNNARKRVREIFGPLVGGDPEEARIALETLLDSIIEPRLGTAADRLGKEVPPSKSAPKTVTITMPDGTKRTVNTGR